MNLTFLERSILKIIAPWIESPPRIVRRSFLRGVFRIRHPEKRRVVYLTFDDGPIPESTPWLLYELARQDVKATFFMVGDNVRKYPHLYADLLARGHKAGNHTMHHLNGLKQRTKHYVDDVDQAADYIESNLFRPPHGWMRFMQKEILCRKYRIIMYDLVTRDYSKFVDAQRIVANVKRYVRPGSIIVFHDSLKSIGKLKAALPECIDWLKSQGYEFETIPDISGKPI